MHFMFQAGNMYLLVTEQAAKQPGLATQLPGLPFLVSIDGASIYSFFQNHI